MRPKLRSISADEEPEFAIADFARPELLFDAICDCFCRIKKRYIPKHIAERG